MLGVLLSASLAGSFIPTALPRPACFWLADSKEYKYETDGRPDSTNKAHVLKLQFANESTHWTQGTSHSRCLSVLNPHGIGETDPALVDANIDPVVYDNGWMPSGTSQSDWIHYDVATPLPSQLYVIYKDIASGVLQGGSSLRVIYRESATVSGVTKHYAYIATFTIHKQVVNGDGPIDTRLMHGTPNDTWETISGNGVARNVNFNPWIFHGGLFAGNMPYQSYDRSGTSRSQLWFPAISGLDTDNLQFAHASLMHLGFWPAPATGGPYVPPDRTPWAACTIGLFAGNTSASETESNATWANRWVSPYTGASGAPSALSTVSFGTWDPTMSRDYANWSIMSTVNSSTHTYNSSALTRAFLALESEDSDRTNTLAKWRYFAGKEGTAGPFPGGVNTNIPYGDKNPRMWVYVLSAVAEHETP